LYLSKISFFVVIFIDDYGNVFMGYPLLVR
jgi:hypothetical protein